MKGNAIITITSCDRDLRKHDERWVQDTAAERRSRIAECIIAYQQRADGPSPDHPHRRYIFTRKIAFSAGSDVTLDQVKALVPLIRERFVIDCFQAAIDRRQGKVYMLFDWFDYSTGQCVYLYATRRTQLAALLVTHLGLPHGDDGGTWTNYYLREYYQADPLVFERLLRHTQGVLQPGSLLSRVMEDMVRHVTLMCLGVKK